MTLLVKYPHIHHEIEFSTKDLSLQTKGMNLIKEQGYIDGNEVAARRYIKNKIFYAWQSEGAGRPLITRAYSTEIRSYLKDFIRFSPEIEMKNKNSLEKAGKIITQICGKGDSELIHYEESKINTKNAANQLFEIFMKGL